jgi:hypothetical protein
MKCHYRDLPSRNDCREHEPLVEDFYDSSVRVDETLRGGFAITMLHTSRSASNDK